VSMSTTTLRLARALALPLLVTIAGCGHSDEEMEAKQREIDKLATDLNTAKGQLAEDQKRYGEAQDELKRLKGQLDQAGLGLAKSKEEMAKLQDALAQYKARADQLAAIEARFKALKAKLDGVPGLKVVIRNNRMVIQLPGDVLFDSGKDELKQGGKDALLQISEIIRSDKDLASRNFQVAGHTDNVRYGGGPFHDNWGLSLARARTVLLFLIAPATEGKDKKPQGGGLDALHWAAAGYGETDPQQGSSATQSKEQQQSNRRVELVLQPSLDEMLDLTKIH